MSVRDKNAPLLSRRGGGRPPKRSKEIEMVLLKAIEHGAPFTLACAHAGICLDTFIDWRRRDPAFHAEVERAVADCALRRLQGVERHGKENFAALCWLLERRHPELFGRPEIKLAVLQQSNVVENHLTVTLSETEAMEIESEAQPIRDAVSAMFQAYRPVSSNGDAGVREIEASPAVSEPPPITHSESDAQNPLFWKRLVSSPPETFIAKGTAVFVIRVLLTQVMGFKGRRLEVAFTDNPTLEEMFSRLKQLGGPACWAKAQALAGYSD
jgi:hypothetical protein